MDARVPSCCRFSLGPGMCLATARLGLPLLSPTVRTQTKTNQIYSTRTLQHFVFREKKEHQKFLYYEFFKSLHLSQIVLQALVMSKANSITNTVRIVVNVTNRVLPGPRGVTRRRINRGRSSLWAPRACRAAGTARPASRSAAGCKHNNYLIHCFVTLYTCQYGCYLHYLKMRRQCRSASTFTILTITVNTTE